MADRARILVVEDDHNLGTVYRSVLEEAGFLTRTVQSGIDALPAVHQFYPDLVITDAILPGMDGFELAEALQGDPATRALPIVFISGVVEPADRERAAKSGVTRYLPKPLRADDLLKAVRDTLAEAAGDRSGTDD